jgi:hypothetical protein
MRVKLLQNNASITFTPRGERRLNLAELFLTTNPDLYPALPFLSNVKILVFGKYFSVNTGDDGGGGPYKIAGAYPRHLTACGDIRITEKHTDAGLALEGLSEEAIRVLPVLITLFLEGHCVLLFVQEATERLVAQRKTSG